LAEIYIFTNNEDKKSFNVMELIGGNRFYNAITGKNKKESQVLHLPESIKQRDTPKSPFLTQNGPGESMFAKAKARLGNFFTNDLNPKNAEEPKREKV
jgi:hypothetical protein